jgi:hypothetical protein
LASCEPSIKLPEGHKTRAKIRFKIIKNSYGKMKHLGLLSS